MPAMATAAEPAEQDLAQYEDAESLPERDRVPSEQRRHQPVPQLHQQKTAHGYGQGPDYKDFHYF